jgi:diphthamide biosynthesis protein 3
MSYYMEVKIEDMDYDEAAQMYFYPCPCGDRFQISVDELVDGEEIGRCPSCSLIIHVMAT